MILSLDEETLQTLLNILHNYCSKWGLAVNIKLLLKETKQKTKVLRFNKGGQSLIKPQKEFLLGENAIETCNNYCYLGIVFVPSGKIHYSIYRTKEKSVKIVL